MGPGRKGKKQSGVEAWERGGRGARGSREERERTKANGRQAEREGGTGSKKNKGEY